MTAAPGGGSSWMLILLALACTPLFPPLGFLVSAGDALYAHRVGRFGLCNVLLAFFVALLLILGVPWSTPNL